jgi:hypothetical protein
MDKFNNIIRIVFKTFQYIIIVIVSICWLHAGDISFSGSAETGRRSTGEDYQEEDVDAEYQYQSYYFRFDQYLNPQFNYNLTSSYNLRQYEKDSGEDNFTRSFTGNGTYSYSPQLAMNLFVKYRDKTYDHDPAADYRQYAVLPTLKVRINRLYSGGILFGLNRYYYTRKKEIQNNYLTKLYGRGYFLNSRLVCIASYQVQVLEKESLDRKKNKQMIMAGTAYRFDLPLLYKLTARVNWGDQDTRDNESQDYDYDYTMINYYLRSDFKIETDLKSNLAWQIFEKDYLSYQRDHRGYSLSNGWDYYPIQDKLRSVWFNLDLGYKTVIYTDNPESGYDKQVLVFKVNYRRRTQWKVSCSCTGNLYQYQNAQNDKTRYNCYLSWEQDVLADRGLLTIDLKSRYTRYFHHANETSLGMRIGLLYTL